MDFSDFYSYNKTGNIKNKKWENQELLVSIHDPALEYLTSYNTGIIINQKSYTKIKLPIIIKTTWFTN